MKFKKYFRRWLWIQRLKHCWPNDCDYGQFLSNVGYEMACGKLPKDILNSKWKPLHKKVVITFEYRISK